jgi:hypothetical protein
VLYSLTGDLSETMTVKTWDQHKHVNSYLDLKITLNLIMFSKGGGVPRSPSKKGNGLPK